MSEDKRAPLIVFNKYSPYMVVDLDHILDHEGNEIPIDPVTSLCRCGASKYKPLCDGSHGQVGFVGDRNEEAPLCEPREYAGEKLSIVDNRGVCAHDKSCITKLKKVFREKDRPWIDPNGASEDAIIDTVKTCPSGALSYVKDGRPYTNFGDKVEIIAKKDGPLQVRGGIVLKEEQGYRPETENHYTLCRCGDSKNKPYCDGTHITSGFKSD